MVCNGLTKVFSKERMKGQQIICVFEEHCSMPYKGTWITAFSNVNVACSTEQRMLGRLPVGQYLGLSWLWSDTQDHSNLLNWDQGIIFLTEFGLREN